MSSNASRSSRQGFTLIELLVVIGILVVLVALLLPVLQSTRQMAYTATCAANQRIVGSAIIGYCTDHDGVFPTTVGAGSRADNWIFWQNGRDFNQSAVAPYLVTKNKNLRAMFVCPAQPVENQSGYSGGAAYQLTYSLNYSVTGYYPFQLRRVRSPQQKILVYDENQNADDDQFWYGTDRDTLAGRHGAVSAQQANVNGTGEKGYERGFGNVYYCDGHVALADNNMCHQAQFNDFHNP